MDPTSCQLTFWVVAGPAGYNVNYYKANLPACSVEAVGFRQAHHKFASTCTHAPASTRSWAVRTDTAVSRSAPPGQCWKLLGQRRHPAQQVGCVNTTSIWVPAKAVTGSETGVPV